MKFSSALVAALFGIATSEDCPKPKKVYQLYVEDPTSPGSALAGDNTWCQHVYCGGTAGSEGDGCHALSDDEEKACFKSASIPSAETSEAIALSTPDHGVFFVLQDDHVSALIGKAGLDSKVSPAQQQLLKPSVGGRRACQAWLQLRDLFEFGLITGLPKTASLDGVYAAYVKDSDDVKGCVFFDGLTVADSHKKGYVYVFKTYCEEDVSEGTKGTKTTSTETSSDTTDSKTKSKTTKSTSTETSSETTNSKTKSETTKSTKTTKTTKSESTTTTKSESTETSSDSSDSKTSSDTTATTTVVPSTTSVPTNMMTTTTLRPSTTTPKTTTTNLKPTTTTPKPTTTTLKPTTTTPKPTTTTPKPTTTPPKTTTTTPKPTTTTRKPTTASNTTTLPTTTATPAPTSTGCACPLIFAPVCGDDGFTHSNACFAGCVGAAVECPGACPCPTTPSPADTTREPEDVSSTTAGTTTPQCKQPVFEIMHLQDVSQSYADDLDTMEVVMPELLAEINSVFPMSRFGLGSFSDKPVAPFGYQISRDYCYRTDSVLTSDIAVFSDKLNNLISRSGADWEESQLDALHHAAKIATSLGFSGMDEVDVGGEMRPVQSVMILSTNSGYHKMGDENSTLMYPNNDDDVLDCENEGYASVAQTRDALKAANMRVVFLVSENVRTIYNNLLTDLDVSGLVVVVADDSSDIKEVVLESLYVLSCNNPSPTPVPVRRLSSSRLRSLYAEQPPVVIDCEVC